jgi:hypothetical protein
VLVGRGVGGREVWVALKLDGNDDPVDFSPGYKYRVIPRLDGSDTMVRSDGTGLVTAPNVVEWEYIVDVLCPVP